MSCKQNITAPPGSKPSAQTSQARTGSRADARALIRQNMGRVAMPASSTALEVWRSQLRTQESDETGRRRLVMEVVVPPVRRVHTPHSVDRG